MARLPNEAFDPPSPDGDRTMRDFLETHSYVGGEDVDWRADTGDDEPAEGFDAEYARLFGTE